MPFKVLIANRGEIALRAIRACKELNISTVSVYSEGDKDLKHLKFSDETVCIGPASPLESYLNTPAILSAAELTQVDGIYPGYGFLAEDSNFAEMCEKSGFKFIGPNSETIKNMGDKITAKTLAEESGIQIVPGYKDDIPEDPEEFKKIAKNIGYPIMIKATAGGGGRGMRVVESEDDLISSAEITMQEAKNAFGNEKIYLEKFIPNPRHIEIQVVGDGKGHAIHLGTRDCSMQRRHQKIIEEAPAKNIDQDALDQTYEASIKLCKKLKYEGAGTIEFLYENAEFYFIEMNTRIQVEHPVTEMITGFDIVKAQLRIALGMEITLQQESINFNGHAMECRINAEDPETFQPTKIGKHCLIMAYSHIAHDCIVGDHCIFSNNSTLAGHISVGNHVILAGMTAVHQFCSIGDHAFVAGGSLVRKDIPPFVKAAREPLSYAGVNSVGLRRRGFDSDKIKEIQSIYRILYQKNFNNTQATQIIEAEMEASTERDDILQFIRLSQRGIMKGYIQN